MTKLNRLTIIPVDGFCSVEGDGYIGIDMVSVPAQSVLASYWATRNAVEESQAAAMANDQIVEV